MTKAARGKRFHSAMVAWGVLTILGYAGDASLHPVGCLDGARAVDRWLRAQLLVPHPRESALALLVQLARIPPPVTYLVPAVAAVVVAAVTYSVRRRGGAVVQRGARLGRPARRERGAIPIGQVSIPREIETQHVLLTGSTGTGKSLALQTLAETIRDRAGDRAVVVDPGGELMARFWRCGDTILNPLDARSVAWSPLAEMRNAADADRLAKSLLPDTDGQDAQQWQCYAQGLTSAVLQRLAERQGVATNADLTYLLTVASAGDLEALVRGLPAQTLFDSAAAKMLGSVRAIIGAYLAPYRFLPPGAGADAWSLRRWVEGGSGWLWIPVRADLNTALRPLIAAWIGELVSATLALPPDRDRRLWLLLDELAALGRVQSLSEALTQGRKFGLCAVAGLQTVAQLRGAYGLQGAQTLLSCFSSQLILRATDPETADWCSRLLGDQQLSRRVKSEGSGAGGSHSGESEQISIERVVLPSEIAGLGDRRGFLRLAGDFPIARVEIPIPPTRVEVCRPFVAATATSVAPEPAAPPAVVSGAGADLVQRMRS
ncbi:MAG: type IV secretion system DNA-binding domain-containing protein [Candidatus Dormibacteria bacterium]